MQQTMKRYYSTKKKNIVLDILRLNQNKRLTAEEIIHTLNKDENVISKATVYRNLDSLVNQGLVCKVVLDNICSCYIYKSDEEDNGINFYCDSCGDVFRMKSDAFKNINTKLLQDINFTVDRSKTVIHGTCNKCKEKPDD